MHPVRKQRLILVCFVVVFSSLAVGLVAYGLRMGIFAYADALPESVRVPAVMFGIAVSAFSSSSKRTAERSAV